MNTSHTKLENGNVVITLQIPWASVQETYDSVIEEIVKEAELPGFRKGKAPRATVEESLDKNKTYEEVLKRLIPQTYATAVTKEQIKPIIAPQITLTKAKEGEDWEVSAVTCERPAITLGDYVQAIKDLKAAKQSAIWVPGQEETKKDEKTKQPSLDEVLEAIYKTTQISLPAVLLEQEITRLLSNLLDDIKKLGLTLDQYLASTGKTIETLKGEYENEAKRSITLELTLSEIGDKEGIQVEEKEIQQVIDSAKSKEEKEGLEKERYYLSSILRRQKTIQHLASL